MLRRRVAFTLLVCYLGVGGVDLVNSASTFSELEAAVAAGTGMILLEGTEIRFLRALDVREGTTVCIESEVRTTLDGGGSNRLFVLQTSAKLRLRRVNLVRGVVAHADYYTLGHGGGAILLLPESELLLQSVNISTSRAYVGGGIHAVRATVVATDCTLSANSGIDWGGAIIAGDDSVATFINSTMTANSANRGGAVYIEGHSVVKMLNCTMTSNYASFGGAVGAEGRPT